MKFLVAKNDGRGVRAARPRTRDKVAQFTCAGRQMLPAAYTWLAARLNR